MAVMSSEEIAIRLKSGREADRLSDERVAGTGVEPGWRPSIMFMEPNSVPRVGVSLVSGGAESAADSVVFRPRGNEAGGPADRAFGIALAQGD